MSISQGQSVPPDRSPHKRRTTIRRFTLTAVIAAASFCGGAIVASRSGPQDSRSAIDRLTPQSAAAVANDTDRQMAAHLCQLLMDEADRVLAEVDDIRSVFHRRERKDGELLPLTVADLKVRRSPKSVYMRWQVPHEGREAIWNQDANDGQILVHAGGWRQRLVPLLRLDPLSERATAESRRPITELGIWNLHRRLAGQIRGDVNLPGAKLTMNAGASIAGRACFEFELEHPDREHGAQYHILRLYIDRELAVPIACERYDWPAAEAPDEPVLVESYAFTELELNAGLSDSDFDIANPLYEFGPGRITRR